MPRVAKAVGGSAVLVAWVIVALTVALPPLNLAGGWDQAPNAFAYGFLVIPYAIGTLAVIGANLLF